MIRIMMIIALIGLLSAHVFSQNKNSYKPGNSWSKTEIDSSLIKRFNLAEIPELIYSPESFDYPDEYMHLNPYDLPGAPQRKIPDDNMPCIKPQGNFSSVIVEPDSSELYHLLIKKP